MNTNDLSSKKLNPTCQVAILGAKGVGKTTLITKLLEIGLNGRQHSSRKNWYTMDYNLTSDTTIKMKFVDAGIEHTGELEMTVKRSNAVILIYSIADDTSFIALRPLLPVCASTSKNIALLLLANKTDLEGHKRQVKPAGGRLLGRELAQARRLTHISTTDDDADDPRELCCPFVELSIRSMADQKQLLDGLLEEIRRREPDVFTKQTNGKRTDKRHAVTSTLCNLL